MKTMTRCTLIGIAGLAALVACERTARWELQASGTTAEFRGLSRAEGGVVWAVGRHGTYARTRDGGATWTSGTVPGASELFFIDVHAASASTAYLLGTHFDGGLAKIFKTMDAGATWIESYAHSSPGVFFDGLAFWDADHGIAFSDPVDGSFLVVTTADGGQSWERVPAADLPAPLPGEAGFAASGTAITVQGARHVWFGTGGGGIARVFRSNDRGRNWTVSETPFAAGPTTGIFGLAFRDTLNGVAVGGDYREPKRVGPNVVRTRDGGITWTVAGQSEPSGVRYGAVYTHAAGGYLVAVGPSGWGYSADDGATWTAIDTLGYNTVVSGAATVVWAAGVEGRIARLRLPARRDGSY